MEVVVTSVQPARLEKIHVAASYGSHTERTETGRVSNWGRNYWEGIQDRETCGYSGSDKRT